MGPEQRAAFVIAQAACANAEIAAMQAENAARLAAGLSQAYSEKAFMNVPDKYLIGHNAVISYLAE
jgi:hypothetical protein